MTGPSPCATWNVAWEKTGDTAFGCVMIPMVAPHGLHITLSPASEGTLLGLPTALVFLIALSLGTLQSGVLATLFCLHVLQRIVGQFTGLEQENRQDEEKQAHGMGSLRISYAPA